MFNIIQQTGYKYLYKRIVFICISMYIFICFHAPVYLRDQLPALDAFPPTTNQVDVILEN